VIIAQRTLFPEDTLGPEIETLSSIQKGRVRRHRFWSKGKHTASLASGGWGGGGGGGGGCGGGGGGGGWVFGGGGVGGVEGGLGLWLFFGGGVFGGGGGGGVGGESAVASHSIPQRGLVLVHPGIRES